MGKVAELSYIYRENTQKQTPRDNIEDAFDKKCRSSFMIGIKNAYRWFGIWSQDPANQVLLKYSGKTAKGNIISWAVTYFLIEEVKKGNIGLNFRIDLTKKSKTPYLVLFDKAKNIELTVNQVPKVNRPARSAVNRFERIQNNFMSTLFETQELKNKEPFYYQLTHGYQTSEPGFINLGIPKDDVSWEDFIDLTKETYVIESEKKPASKPVVVGPVSLEDIQNNIDEVMENE